MRLSGNLSDSDRAKAIEAVIRDIEKDYLTLFRPTVKDSFDSCATGNASLEAL